MISLLENGYPTREGQNVDEEQLVALIYRFANKKEEWFNLLLSLSNCLSVSESLPADHPHSDITKRLLAHLKNALQISSQLHNTSKHLSSPSVLNHIPTGAIIIDSNGRIVEINQLGEIMLPDIEELHAHNNYLHYQGSASALQSLLRDQKIHEGAPFNVTVRYSSSNKASRLRRKKDTGMLRLHITAIPTTENNSEPDYFYLTLQSYQDTAVRTEQLINQYGLTETEALVASTLVNELSNKETADKLKLKEATVRGHLTNIYQKTGVTRKPELIRQILLHSLVPPVNPQTGQLPLTHLHQFHEGTSCSIYLRDGRRLSYMDHRPTRFDNKKPRKHILILHNLMGSGLELPPAGVDLLEEYNLRIIVPERPGYGDSDPHPLRTHEDWCKDVEELLNTLKIDKVDIIAHSVGGVYALAMTKHMPNRIRRIAMANAMTRISDMQNTDQPAPAIVKAVLRSLRYAPFLIEPILKMAVGKDIEHFYEQQLSYIRPTREGRAADINLLKTQSYRRYSIANLKQSAKQGIRIWADELRLSFAELGLKDFDQTIEFQFWHGDHDDVIPAYSALNLSKELNTLFFKRIGTETHFLFARQFVNIVSELVDEPASQQANNSPTVNPADSLKEPVDIMT